MNSIMINKKFLLVPVLIAFFLFESCVAKRKYLEMENSRNKAEQRIRELTDEVGRLKTEFNAFKNEFHFNDDTKESYIDSLNRTITRLHSDLSNKDESIEDQIFTFQVEKRRLNQMLNDKDREIRNLNREANALKIRIDDLEKEVQDMSFSLKNTDSSARSMERQLQMKDQEISDLQSKYDRARRDIATLNTTISDQKQEIERLTNNVNLLKAQLGQNPK
ncbi:MAG TPA: hypothetical protein PLK12_05325 [Prolixibacteraceae bacterium]|nr:hypothetical protein [Prolixibacteraceae bacterium]